jgi:lipopolysaccharide export system permease protein
LLKRLDTLVLKELLGPWIFGVSMFTMLLIAATYLGRIARYMVEGVPVNQIITITVLLLPAVLVKTFAMALLLGGLLAFGRLSGDSEITAVRASGVSLYRIVWPVSVFSMLVALLSFYLNEQVVPPAARQSAALMIDIAKKGQLREAQPVKQFVVQGGKVVLMVGAVNFSPVHQTLEGVHIVSYDKDQRETWIMFAKELQFTDLKQWKILGGADVLSRDGTYKFHVDEAWPKFMPSFTSSPEEILTGQSSDLDIWSMAQIQEQIRKGRQSQNLTSKEIRNLEFGYWNKIALPLAAFIFGTLGATLGIRNHRTGAATGFAVAVAIIFSYFTLTNFMSVYAMGGLFPPYVASFTPIAIGLIASGVIIWRRNR